MDAKERKIVDLYKELKHFKNIEQDLTASLNTAPPEKVIDEQKVSDQIDSLQEKFVNLTTAKDIEELTAKTLQYADLIHGSPSIVDEDVAKLLSERDKINEQIIELNNKTRQLEKEITELQKEENNISAKNQESIKDLKTKKKMDQAVIDSNRESDLTRRLKKRIKKYETQAKLSRFILRFLILGSGIDWIKDSNLKEIMQRCEKLN